MNISSSTGGSGALQNAVAGINRGLAGVNRDALAIAQATPDSGRDATNALADLSQQSLFTQYSAGALSIVNETVGTLLNAVA